MTMIFQINQINFVTFKMSWILHAWFGKIILHQYQNTQQIYISYFYIYNFTDFGQYFPIPKSTSFLFQDNNILRDHARETEEAAPVGQVECEEDDGEDHPAVLVYVTTTHT